jgi:hypothetical protein
MPICLGISAINAIYSALLQCLFDPNSVVCDSVVCSVQLGNSINCFICYSCLAVWFVTVSAFACFLTWLLICFHNRQSIILLQIQGLILFYFFFFTLCFFHHHILQLLHNVLFSLLDYATATRHCSTTNLHYATATCTAPLPICTMPLLHCHPALCHCHLHSQHVLAELPCLDLLWLGLGCYD